MYLDAVPGMCGAQPIGSKFGLGQRERTAASTKPDRLIRKRWRERHARTAEDGDEIRAAPSKSEARLAGRFAEVAGIQNLRKSR